ncbi:uncharacterized protein [Nicotiana tomentosiformis]|uniref:uncharacterized protein n=1 Tax=Nicotiana tomentosiformis TaxID=4098 RepID=UPI00388CC46B
MGDYNAIRHYDDRIKGNPVQEHEVADFKRFMVDTNMVELKTTGRRYAWTNNHVLSKIDWVLVNSEWMTTWTHVEATALDPYFSGHTPLAIEIGGRGFKGARPFRFFNHLAQHPDFLSLVNNQWNCVQPVRGMEAIWKELAEIQHETRDPQKQVELAEEEKELKQQLEKWVLIEECILKQKSRVKWLQLGDANNAYFYACMKNRTAHNQIRKLNTIDGNIAQTEKEVEIEVVKFYQKLLGAATDILPTIQLDVLDEGHKLTRDQQLKLIELVSREEVYNAVEDIDDQKAPGCDGFNFHFFKKSWQVVGEEIIYAVMDFFHTGNMFKPINCTSVTLVPKGDKESVQLINNCFKTFSEASGLIANPTKSSVYCGGVNPVLQQQLLDILGFLKGELPFRYLGVPLSSKRLAITQCQPPLEKILGRITGWTTKFLSYAGRVMLIKSILFSIQTFWSQVFVLPKKIINEIVATCKKFLWSGEANGSNKALLAWETLCYPKTAGGVNFTDVELWNKAATYKPLWNGSMAKAVTVARYNIGNLWNGMQKCNGLYHIIMERMHLLKFTEWLLLAAYIKYGMKGISKYFNKDKDQWGR